MHKGKTFHWQQLFILGCLSMLLAPGWSQDDTVKPEVILNNVSLDSSFVEVLNRLGMPHYIGPSVSGMDSITKLLRPIEQKGTSAGAAAPGYPNAQAPRTPAPTPYGTNAGTQALSAPPKKENIFMVWRYDGNGKTPDPKASFTTYVLINDLGKVEAVVVNLNNPQASPNIQTETEITFGTRLSDIVKVYNWPDPYNFTRLGSLYYCSYPKQKVAFALDAATRKVMCISIGVPLVVTAQSLVAGESATAGAAVGQPALVVPQVPGGMYLPGMMPLGDMPPGVMFDGDIPPGMMIPGGGPYPGMPPTPPMPPR